MGPIASPICSLSAFAFRFFQDFEDKFVVIVVGSAGYGVSVNEEMEVDELKVFHKIHSHVQARESW